MTDERILRRRGSAEVTIAPDIAITVADETRLESTELSGGTFYRLSKRPTLVTVRLGARVFRFEVAQLESNVA